MATIKARSTEEYVDLVQQSIFEVEELFMAAEFDMESMGVTASFVADLDKVLKDLYASMKDGTYHFENKDLPYMPIVEKYDERSLPFKFMLRRINETHRYGLEIED
ncbi:MAG: general secretion pathway protein GspF [Gammaproteobacteria bacterium]|nr:general secretion pathway protein GspF [Gammaproteobacteria bacterium]